MNLRRSIAFTVATVLSLTAIVLFPFALSGCGRDTPQAPQVIYVQGTSGDNGSGGEADRQLIPTGSVYFSVYLSGAGTMIDLNASVYGISSKARFVIARIDYSIANRATTGVQFINGNYDNAVLSEYRLPASTPAAGTFTLTYPVEPNYVGGGLSFVLGSGSSQTLVCRVKLNGGLATDYATLYGYAF
jgi:hypothetical protein